MKRLLDVTCALGGLIVLSPLLLVVMFLVWRQDKGNPFYIAPRVGKGERVFRMFKLRSMVKNADKSGVDSTSASDMRITPVGHFIRRYKLDEVSQLINVLIGDMSLVGPRPNVKRETDLYTSEEKKLLSVRPGITDFSSIIFSDEGDILDGKPDPDLAYNQLIRPWKSRLGLFYVENMSPTLDVKILFLTVLSILSRSRALARVSLLLESMKAPKELVSVAKRERPLTPHPPPGASQIVENRSVNG